MRFSDGVYVVFAEDDGSRRTDSVIWTRLLDVLLLILLRCFQLVMLIVPFEGQCNVIEIDRSFEYCWRHDYLRYLNYA